MRKVLFSVWIMYLGLGIISCCVSGRAQAAEKPQLALQIGHSASVVICAFSPDGALLASGGIDSTMRIWDVASGKIIFILRGHPFPVTALSFSPDSRSLATLSADGTLNVWDMHSGRRREKLEKVPPCMAPRLSFRPDGKVLAVLGGGDSALLVDMETKKIVQRIPLGAMNMTYLGMGWSPDGTILAVGSVNCSERVSLWDWKAGKKIRVFSCAPDKASSVPSILYSPDGKVVACGIEFPAPDGKETGEIILFDASSGREMRRLPRGEKGFQFLSFSPDSTLLACSFVNLITTPADAKVQYPDSSASYNYLRIWDIHTGKTIVEQKDDRTGPLAFSPDGRTLAVASVNEIELRPLEAGPPGGERKIVFGKTRKMSGMERNIDSVVFCPGGQALAFDVFTSQGQPGEIILWDTGAGILLNTIMRKNYQGGLNFILKGSSLAFSNKDCSQCIVEIPSGKEKTRLPLENPADGSYPLVAFSPDGKLLAQPAADYTIKIWDMERKKELRRMKGHSGEIGSLVFSPDGTTLASVSNDKTLKLWDVATGNVAHTIGGFESSVGKVNFSADGRTLAASSTCTSRDNQGAAGAWRSLVKVFDARSGKERAVMAGNSLDEIQTLAVSPDGTLLAGGSLATTVTLWDTGLSKERCRLRGLTLWTKSLSFSPDGKILAGASEHNTLKFWSTATGKELATLVSTGPGDWVAVTPEGFFDGTPKGIAHIDWRMGRTLCPLESFFNEFYQPGLMKDILAKHMSITEILQERGDGRASLDIAEKDRRLPSLTLEAPATASTRKVLVKVGINEAPRDAEHPGSGSGVKDTRLFLDGVLVRKWAGEQKPGTVLTCEIPVKAGENTISAYAFNRDNVKSRDVEIKVHGAPSLKHQGQAYILSIGINAYSLPRFSLACAVKDAEDLAGSLEKNLPFPGSAIHVSRLTDQQATREGILRALASLVAMAGPEDTVIITYAGHGITYERSFYLIPCDLGTKEDISMKDLASRGINDEELERIFVGEGAAQGLHALHIALILDACHSGQVLEADEWRVGPMNSRGLAQLAWEKGMEVLTASQSNQFANELKSLGHGLLTYALLEGFSMAPREGPRLEGPAWLDFAAREVPRIAQGDRVRGLVPAAQKPMSTTVNTQVPRIFHRRQGGDLWIVSESRR